MDENMQKKNSLEVQNNILERDQWKIIFEDQEIIAPTTPVSIKSKYGDMTWSWKDAANPRLDSYCQGRLTIDWEQFLLNRSLTLELVADLKKYVYFRSVYSPTMFPRSTKIPHPRTLVGEVTSLIQFLIHLRRELYIRAGILVSSLSNIEIQDLQMGLSSYPAGLSEDLKRSLKYLTSKLFGKTLERGAIQWNNADIDILPLKKKRVTHYKRLPDKLFVTLSNSATEDVKQFLEALQIVPYDATRAPNEKPNRLLKVCEDFKEVFEQYVKLKNDYRSGSPGVYRYRCWSRLQKNTNQLVQAIERVRLAAQIIIMLYTGARISEFAGFKLGCLRQRGEGWVIVGTVIKRRNLSAPIENDEWIAIPIVCDAVRVLEQTASVVGAKLLFHSSCRPRNPDAFMTSYQVSARIRSYIALIDAEGEWKGVKPHSHQFRNSLVYEMRRAGVSIPFISYQLKHTYDEVNRSLNDTTLNYGSIGGNAVMKAIEKANSRYERK